MKGQSRNPQVTSRQHRALVQRQRELDAWQDEKSDLYLREMEVLALDPERDVTKHIAAKVAAARQDIENLNAKGIN